MVVSPVFLGAEPNEIDEGAHAGRSAFTDRIRLGTDLMAALSSDLRAAATVYWRMVDPAMPLGRIHPGDERHLAGADAPGLGLECLTAHPSGGVRMLLTV